MNLTNNESKLPYIIFPELNLKILIDTGSTRSFIKPDIANKYFNNSIRKDPFKISTVHGTSIEKFSTLIPSSKIFKINQKPLKFYLFDFHNYFDCLLGIDNLTLLGANVNLNKNILSTPETEIKLLYHNIMSHNTNCIELQPRCEQVIKINIKNLKNGNGILPHMKFDSFEIPECLVKIENSQAICSIVNLSDSEKSIDLSNPIEVVDFNEYEVHQKNSQNFNNLNFQKFKFDISKVRHEHLNSEERNAILGLLKEYSDIFHIEGNQLTFTSKIKHTINTTDEIPVHTKSYRYPEIYRKEVQRQIHDMLDQKIIRPSFSPWSSPIWVVPKKADASGKKKFRIVCDFRKINLKTVGDRYPLPNITDLLDKLGRCQYFTTLDLASGFHQIEMAENDIQKTAFNTENGHYEFLRMPFGLKTAPATFQRVVDNILRGLQNEICAVYLDDIIIFSTSLQEHVHRLRQVFERLREANFKIQLDKSEFLRKEVAYLGHIVTPDGVKPNPQKIEAIQNYPIPSTPKAIKGFLGLLGYYRKFIPDFAKLTKPLTKCLKKDAKINTKDPEYIKCFELCKNLLTNEPILQYPNFEKPFILTCDSSNFALGSVLSQGKIGSDLPVAYASRTLNESEINYSTIEKELLAIVWSVKYFRPYLFGRKFQIVTDHKPLEWLFSLKEPNSKLVRWRLKLEEYDYEIVYKKGVLNKNADALSRIELNANETTSQPNSIFTLNKYVENFNQSLQQNQNETPSENQSVIVETGDLDNPENAEEDETVHSNVENPIVGIPIIDCPVNYGKNQIIISEVNFAPAEPTRVTLYKTKQRTFVQFSKNNYEKEIVKFIKEIIVPKIKYYLYFEDPIYEKFSSVLQKYFKNSQIQMIKCTKKLIDVTTDNDITEKIQNHHEGKTNHRGIEETEKRIKSLYYWPNQQKSIQTYINNCEICQATKYDRRPLRLEFNITPTAIKPFQILHIDSISLENCKFLTITDSFSKYAQAYKLNSCQSIEIANNLIKYFTHHCIPDQIISDNGGEFKNSVIREILTTHKIKIHFISSQHPESNGLVERFHSTLIEHIRLLNNQDNYKKEPIEIKVNYALLAYNNTIHSVTNLKPYEIITGHLGTESPFNVEIDNQLVNNYVISHRDKMKILYQKLNEDIQKKKEIVINKANQNREKLPEIPDTVHIKNKQKQGKTLNKYKKQTIRTIDKNLKTAKIKTTHPNTTEKIHISDVKRPKKKTYKFKNISGSSSSQPDKEQK